MASSQSQDSSERQAMTSNAQKQRQSVSILTTGGQLNVDVGDGQYVSVPNTSARAPTRQEIYQALVAAGHQERADEHADRAYENVTGTNTE